MDLLNGLFSRKSIRNYTDKMISDEELDVILKAANAAPVGRGRYDTLHLTVVSDPSLLKRIDELTAAYLGKPDAHPLYGAPLFIIVSVKENSGLPDNVSYSNAAIVAHNMALAAMSLEIGTCLIWGAIRAVNESQSILKELNFPQGFKPSCAITLGCTDEAYSLRDIPNNRLTKNFISNDVL